jgi:hypothetical protein
LDATRLRQRIRTYPAPVYTSKWLCWWLKPWAALELLAFSMVDGVPKCIFEFGEFVVESCGIYFLSYKSSTIIGDIYEYEMESFDRIVNFVVDFHSVLSDGLNASAC